MTHEHTCQGQMLVGSEFLLLLFFDFFSILSDRNLKEIWIRREANGKHAWSQGRFFEQVVQNFYRFTVLKIHFKDTKIKDKLKSYR